MSQQTKAERILSMGLLASLVAGLITGICARIVMRIVAITAHMTPDFSVPGSLNIVMFAFILGLVPGCVYALSMFFLYSSPNVSKHLPGSIWRGLIFGVLLLVIVGLPAVLIPLLPNEDLSLGVPLLNKFMFIALLLIYGITLGVAEKIFDHFIPGKPVALTTETADVSPQVEE